MVNHPNGWNITNWSLSLPPPLINQKNRFFMKNCDEEVQQLGRSMDGILAASTICQVTGLVTLNPGPSMEARMLLRCSCEAWGASWDWNLWESLGLRTSLSKKSGIVPDPVIWFLNLGAVMPCKQMVMLCENKQTQLGRNKRDPKHLDGGAEATQLLLSEPVAWRPVNDVTKNVHECTWLWRHIESYWVMIPFNIDANGFVWKFWLYSPMTYSHLKTG